MRTLGLSIIIGPMVLRRSLALFLVLTLVGCSMSYPVKAVFITGKLHFQPDEKLNGCLNRFRVETEDGEVMWQLEGSFRSSPCEDNFPLAYGTIPTGLTSRVAAKPLSEGVLYKVEGSDGDRYYGAFRYGRQQVINTPEIARRP